jgi:hypothetical protein
MMEVECKFIDNNTAFRRLGNPGGLRHSPSAAPEAGIRYADGTQVTSDSYDETVAPEERLVGNGPPVVTLVGTRGSLPTWAFQYWVWPLPVDGATLFTRWPACGLQHVEWPLQPAVIENALRSAAELTDLRTTAAADGLEIDSELAVMADIVARLADLGAGLGAPMSPDGREPFVTVPVGEGSVEIHQVTSDYLPNLKRVLDAGGVHLVRAEGAINAQTIVIGADAAVVARALATLMKDLDRRSPPTSAG